MNKDCANCTQKGSVFSAAPVPFVVHENMRAQMETANRRLVGVIVLLVLLLVVSNLAWLWYESQFSVEESHIEIEQDTDGGGDNYVVGGNMTYGQTESQDNSQEADP